MEKFVRKNGKDPFINTPNDTTPALFGHINAIVTEINSSGTTTGLRSKTVVHDFSQKPLLEDQSLVINDDYFISCLLYTVPSPRDSLAARMPSSALKKKIYNSEHYHNITN